MAKQGIWKIKEDGEIVFEETDFQTKGVSEFTPEQMGLVKSCEFDLFFLKETEDPNEFEIKTKTWFCQHVKMRIREAFNLWLKLDGRKYFVLDVLHGMCILAPLLSDSTLIVEKSRPKKVSLEIVKEALNDKTKPFLFFGMVSGSDPQNLDYGKTVSA